MAATMTLAQLRWLLKSYCRFCTWNIETFTDAFARKFYEKIVAFIQNRSLELYWKQTLKFVSSTKMDFVFTGLNLNIII